MALKATNGDQRRLLAIIAWEPLFVLLKNIFDPVLVADFTSAQCLHSGGLRKSDASSGKDGCGGEGADDSLLFHVGTPLLAQAARLALDAG